VTESCEPTPFGRLPLGASEPGITCYSASIAQVSRQHLVHQPSLCRYPSPAPAAAPWRALPCRLPDLGDPCALDLPNLIAQQRAKSDRPPHGSNVVPARHPRIQSQAGRRLPNALKAPSPRSRSNTTTSAPSAANASAAQRPLREPPTTFARSGDILTETFDQWKWLRLLMWRNDLLQCGWRSRSRKAGKPPHKLRTPLTARPKHLRPRRGTAQSGLAGPLLSGRLVWFDPVPRRHLCEPLLQGA
jgi:hypothetical protein